MTTSDNIIWQQMKDGSKAALEVIYRREVDYLYNYCHRLTNDTDLIREAIQELFVELWNKRINLGMTNAIRPYLTTSIRRKVIHHLTKQKRISSESELILNTQAVEAADTKIIAKEKALEDRDKLSKTMESLSDRQKEAIYLKFYQEHSYDEICQIMNINYQSARNLVSSGLRKMKSFILHNSLFWILLSTIWFSTS